MTRYRNQSRYPSRRQSNKEWAANVDGAFTTLASGTKVLHTTFVLSNAGIDETVLRAVGGIAISSDQSIASESQVGAMGICVVSDRAVTVGISAIPDPVTEASDDFWLLYVPFCQRSDLAITSPSSVWYPFDSSGKRKVMEGQTIVLVVANSSGSTGLQFAINLRLLTMVRGTGS